MTFQMTNIDKVWWKQVRVLAVKSDTNIKALIIGLLEDAITKNINMQTYRRKQNENR